MDVKYRTLVDQAMRKLTIWQTSDPNICQYKGVFWEEIIERSIKDNKNLSSSKQKKHTTAGSGADKEGTEDTIEPEEIMMVEVTWMQPYLAYMIKKTVPEDAVEARRIVRRSKAFVVVQGKLYKKSISGVLQRCVTPKKDKSY
jgi:hypothetical protein